MNFFWTLRSLLILLREIGGSEATNLRASRRYEPGPVSRRIDRPRSLSRQFLGGCRLPGGKLKQNLKNRVSDSKMPPKRKRDSAKSATFRFQSITLYATFPKCPTSKEKVVANMLAEWENKLDYWIVCSEKHQDGDLHLHVLIKFKSKLDRHVSSFADFLSKNEEGKTFHGNYQSARDVHKIIEYIKKDGNFIDSGNLPVKKAKLSTTVALALQEGKTLRQINELDPGYMLNNLRKIREYASLCQDFKQEDQDATLAKLPLPIVLEGSSPEVQQLIDWCNKNFYQRDRPIREPQLWLKTPIRCGKTTWLSIIQKFMRCYIVGYERESFDEYHDDKYDIIVFDEYKNQKKLEFLNSLIDGQSKRLMQLYKTEKTTKKVNLPVVFLSNYSPEEAYHSASSITRDAFIDRLFIVEFLQSDLFPFIDYLNAILLNNQRELVPVDQPPILLAATE